MRLLLTLYRKELKGYFLSPFGWIVLAFAATMQGWSLSTAMAALSKTPLPESLIYITFHTPNFWFYFLFLFPLITMRLFAEEERSGTLETMLTAPVSTWQVVLSKYCAAFSFYSVLWIPTVVHFQLFKALTDIPAPFSNGALVGILAFVLLNGAFYVAVGCLASALTSSQIIAGIITCGLLLIHFGLGFITLYAGDGFAAAPLLHYLSSQLHLETFSKGLLDTRPVVYYLTMTAFCLILTLKVVDFRRWRQ
jgi:ABC-2 type transport system permease protein